MKTRLVSMDLLEETKIPKKFWGLGADTYIGQKDVLEQADHYIRKFGHRNKTLSIVGILFVGPPNSFKTFLSTYVLKCLMIRGVSVKYFTAESLTDAYLLREEVNMITQLRSNHCVVIDNLGLCFNKSMRNAVEKAVRFLSDNLIHYIVCTTLEDDFEIAGQYGQVVASHFSSELIRVECNLPANGKSHFELEREKERMTHYQGVKSYK
jgi:hypothetical protein